MQYIIYKYNLSIQIKEIFTEKIHGIWLCVKQHMNIYIELTK